MAPPNAAGRPDTAAAIRYPDGHSENVVGSETRRRIRDGKGASVGA